MINTMIKIIRKNNNFIPTLQLSYHPALCIKVKQLKRCCSVGMKIILSILSYSTHLVSLYFFLISKREKYAVHVLLREVECHPSLQ